MMAYPKKQDTIANETMFVIFKLGNMGHKSYWHQSKGVFGAKAFATIFYEEEIGEATCNASQSPQGYNQWIDVEQLK